MTAKAIRSARDRQLCTCAKLADRGDGVLPKPAPPDGRAAMHLRVQTDIVLLTYRPAAEFLVHLFLRVFSHLCERLRLLSRPHRRSREATVDRDADRRFHPYVDLDNRTERSRSMQISQDRGHRIVGQRDLMSHRCTIHNSLRHRAFTLEEVTEPMTPSCAHLALIVGRRIRVERDLLQPLLERGSVVTGQPPRMPDRAS
jgi:hypothetical protein